MKRYFPTRYFLRFLIALFGLGLMTEMALTTDAEARAGKGRSFGQRSAPSYSRPAPQQSPNYNTPPPASPSRGSFMKGLAGGIAGGFLGSMLFSSLGHAAGPGGLGGGGIGLLEIILLGGVAFLLYRFWKSRQEARLQPAFSGGTQQVSSQLWREPVLAQDPTKPGYFASQSSQSMIEALDRETAEDLFFRVQAAWTRRDLNLVRDILTAEAAQYLDADIRSLKEHGHINHLENISIRQFSITDSWIDGERSYHKVRFTANLLDYTSDESGRILEGSNSVPVKFDEYWIFVFAKDLRRWQLAGIETI